MDCCVLDRDKSTSVRVSEIPAYLHKSCFYRSLNTDNDDSFTIHVAYYKPDPFASNSVNFQWLLETIRYWGVDDVVTLLLQYSKPFLANNCSSELSEMYENEMPFLKHLQELLGASDNADQMMEIAMKSGCLEIVQFVRKTYSISIDWKKIHLQTAAKYGYVQILKYAYDNGCALLFDDLLRSAVTHGHLNCVRFLHEKRCPAPYDICRTAVRNHHLHILKYLISVFYHAHGSVRAAIEIDDEESLYYLLTEARYPLPADACNSAARHGSLSCLMYLHKNHFPYTTQVFSDAVLGGNVECVQYLCKQECPKNVHESYKVAVRNRRWQCLEVLLDHAHPDERIIHQYIRPPNMLEIVNDEKFELLHKLAQRECHINAWFAVNLVARNLYNSLAVILHHNCEKTTDICATAAYYGYLECLKVAHEGDCPWGPEVCSLAIENGHLECLKYAHEHGCPWYFTAGIRTGNVDCLQYAEQHGCVVGRRCKK